MKTRIKAAGDYKKLSDENLIFRYVRYREHQAVHYLFDRYAHLVFGIASKYYPSAQSAAEATRKIFIRLTDDLLRFEITEVKTWLLKYVKTYCLLETGRSVPVQNANDGADTDVEHENSVCFTTKQMKHYLAGEMTDEEIKAAETHLDSCPVCSAAIEGAHEYMLADTINALNELNGEFLNEYFSLTNPQIHLNSLAPVAHTTHSRRHGRHKKQGMKPVSIAVMLLLLGLTIWYVSYGKHLLQKKKIVPMVHKTQLVPAVRVTV